jgi:hypothetical protein
LEEVEMTGNDNKHTQVLRRRDRALERLATWIGFAGAVVPQSSALLLCSQAVSDNFAVGSLVIPAAIALGGVALIGGGRLVAGCSRPASAPRPQLRLVGENRPQPNTETRRSAA